MGVEQRKVETLINMSQMLFKPLFEGILGLAHIQAVAMLAGDGVYQISRGQFKVLCEGKVGRVCALEITVLLVKRSAVHQSGGRVRSL